MLVLAAVAAVSDWWAVAREHAVMEYVSKPLATTAVLAMVASFDTPHGPPWIWFIVAFAFCTMGDVYLMLPRDMFVPGLASFAIAQILFTVGFAVGEARVTRVLVGVVIVIPLALLLLRRFVVAMRRVGHGEFVGPVIGYVVVIASMAVASVGSGNAVAIAGAGIFMLSDSLIAESRFVKARSWHPVGIMVTYHLALVGLALSLL